ncbi:MAG: spore germination protein, partial [Clostridia bacterium]
MVDKDFVTESVISPIIDINDEKNLSICNLKQSVLKVYSVSEVQTLKEALNGVLKNKLILFIDGEEKFLLIDAENFPSRIPDEPPTSAVIKGPREGFTENIKTNITLIRRRLATKNLKMENIFVGRNSNTQITVAYLKNIANQKVVQKVLKKIKSIDIDGIVDSYYILHYLEERKFSMFKQVGSCEKPDIVCAKMLEGRVVILVNNSPIVLTVPFMLVEDLQSSNDYYGRAQYSTFIRWVRVFG